MKSRFGHSKQAGSSELTIVIIIVVLILGGLSYALYRTLTKSTNTSSPSISAVTTENDTDNDEKSMETGSTDNRFAYVLNFNYPKEWKLETDPSEKLEAGQPAKAGDYVKVTITSPSRGITVNYTIFNEPQLGGSCDSASAPKIESISIEESKNIDNTVLLEEYHKGSAEDSYQLLALLTNKDKFTNGIPKVGDSYCTAYDGVFPVELGGAEYVGGINIDTDTNLSLNKDDLQSILESTEYKQARKILLSTSIKKQ